MPDFTLDITVDLDAEVRELRSLVTLTLDNGVKLPESVIHDIRRALAAGRGAFDFECHRSDVSASRTGEYSFVLHLTDKLRKIMPALRAACA